MDVLKNQRNELSEMKEELTDVINTFEKTGALPSPNMEMPYSIMLGYLRTPEYKDDEFQNKLMYVFVEHYFKQKYHNKIMLK